MASPKKSYQLPNYIRNSVYLLEKIHPYLAYRFARFFFFRPIRFKRPAYEEAVFDSAEKIKVLDNQGRGIQVYSWGAGPTVLLTHGWSGRGTQMGYIALALQKAGFHALAFDAPAHGLSAGSKSNLEEMVETIELLTARYPDTFAYIGHSIGGLASLHAAIRVGRIEKTALIGSPNRITEIIFNFCKMIRATQKVADYLNQDIELKFGKPSDDFSSETALKKLPELKGLVVHDEADLDVALDNAKQVKDAWGDNCSLMITQGLGHRRILSDESVANRLVNFVKS